MKDTNFEYEGSDLEAMANAPRYHQWIVRDFSPYLGEKILEVGAGIGEITKVLSPSAKQYVWVEPDPKNAASLKENDELQMPHIEGFQGFGEEYYAQNQNSFDSILYVNVLEHISDDRGEMKLACQALREGGYICIFVPALPWLYGAVDRSVGHYRRYTRSSLKKVFSEEDFEIVRCRYFDMAGVLPWYLSTCLLGNTTPNPSLVKVFDCFFVPIMKNVERIPPPFGKNLLMVARKKNKA